MDEFLLSEIHFNEGDLPLNDYEQLTWKLKETRVVEFFPNVFFPVTLISTEIPEFEDYLHELEEVSIQNELNDQCNTTEIALDLEWEDELCLFQFCSSKRVLIVRHPNGPGNEILQKFLSTHHFFAKGASNDKKQLKLKFGQDFHQNIEDIAQTRLVPYGFSENFMQMTYQFAGKPTADFKDIRITTSNWSQKYLTMRQILYAAFDVVAIYQCYPNFPPPKILTKPQKQLKIPKQKNLNPNKKRQKTSKIINNNKSSALDDNNEKIKITMKKNNIRSAFCYMITNYIGSSLYSDLYDILCTIIDEENINFISIYPKSSQSQKKTDIQNQIKERLKKEKYKEFENIILNKYNSISNDDSDVISYPKNNSFTIFISLFNEVDIKKLIEIFPKSSQVLKLPFVNPEESSDGDFLYIYNLPKNLSEKSSLDRFLHCFEIDHRITIIEIKDSKQFCKDTEENENNTFLYAKIEVCCASSSYNLKCFVPFITIDGKSLKLFTFPYFLNSIIASNFPPTFNEDDCRNMFSKFGQISSIRTLIRRSEEDNNQFVISYTIQNEAYSNRSFYNIKNDCNTEINDPCELAIKAINYIEIEGNEILVSRFAEEQHMRTLRSYELAISLKDVYMQHPHPIGSEFISSKKIRSIFSQFGEIHQAYFDKRLIIGHVQFFQKSSAYNALDYFNRTETESNKDSKTIEYEKKFDVDFDVMKKFDVFFPPEGSAIIVRDVSCSMPQDEIIRMCEMYGRVINFVVRLIIPKFRYQIVEVTYNDVSDALKAKKELDNRRIDNIPIVVSVFRGAGCEVPMWKMEQRYQWIVIDGIALDEKESFETFEKFGTIIDYEVFGRRSNLIKEKKIEKEDDDFQHNSPDENNPSSKTMIMFNDPRSAEAAIDYYNNSEENDHPPSKSFTLRYPSLREFASDVRWNRLALQTEAFVPFKNTVNEAQQLAIVIDPIPPGFTQQWLKKQCPKCFYTLAVTRSSIDPAHCRKAVIFVDGMKMTKKIFALIRNQRCTKPDENSSSEKNLSLEKSSKSEKNSSSEKNLSSQRNSSSEKNLSLEKNSCSKEKVKIDKNSCSEGKSNTESSANFVDAEISDDEEEESDGDGDGGLTVSGSVSNDDDVSDDANDGDVLHPVIMSREDALSSGVVVGAGGGAAVHSPISIIIDPLPDELASEKKIRTNILMDKDADIDIFESASESGKLMCVVLPKLKEDCKVILRKFRRWRVDGLPLNVKKIINVEDTPQQTQPPSSS